MRCAVALALLGLAVTASLLTAAPAKQKHSHAKSAKASSSKTRTTRSTAKHTSSHSRSRRRRSRRHVAARPSFQLHPDPERYKQIQQALADRGFFKGDVNGVWGHDSVDALQRFQTARNITDNDGKINALSLNALGLGAKHEGGGLALSSTPPPPSPSNTPNSNPPK